jgi:putative transposase
MNEDTTILPFRQSETILDPLTELAREGARRMLAEALKAEADAFVASFSDEQLEDGHQRIVRHGFGPERRIQTGIGALDV